jgi:hypothetical protein
MTFDKKAYQRELMRKRRAKNLGAVPVLAESTALNAPREATVSGQARESISGDPSRRSDPKAKDDSCGGTQTSTDALFHQYKPDWYLGEKESWSRRCWRCGERYSTRLELNKFCSPDCKNEYLREALHARIKE